MSYEPTLLGNITLNGTLLHGSGVAGKTQAEIGSNASDVQFATLAAYSASDLEYLKSYAPHPGYAAWFDPAQGLTTSGGKVTQWVDRSGAAYVASQGTTASQPSTGATLNGVPLLTFDGTDDRLSANAIAPLLSAAGPPFTVIWMSRPTVADSGGGGGRTVAAWYGTASTSFLYLGHYGTAFQPWRKNDPPTSASTFPANVVAGATVANVAGVYAISNNGAIAGSAYKNGPTANNFTFGANGTFTFDTFGLGQAGTSGFFKGDLGDVFIYQSQLSQANIDQTLAYLGQKYGIF